MVSGNYHSEKFIFRLLLISIALHLLGYFIWVSFFYEEVIPEETIQVELLIQEARPVKKEKPSPPKKARAEAKTVVKPKTVEVKPDISSVDSVKIPTPAPVPSIRLGGAISTEDLFKSKLPSNTNKKGYQPNLSPDMPLSNRPELGTINKHKSSVINIEKVESGKGDSGYSPQLRRKSTGGEVSVVKTGKTTNTTVKTSFSGVSGISGEVVNRKVIFKPEIPQTRLNETVKIVLGFQVSPTGEVIDVTPVVRASKQFEDLAVDYIRKYRFEPIKQDIVQSGVIELILKR